MPRRVRIIPKKVKCSRCRTARAARDYPLMENGERSKSCRFCLESKGRTADSLRPPTISAFAAFTLGRIWVGQEPRVPYAQAMERKAKGWLGA